MKTLPYPIVVPPPRPLPARPAPPRPLPARPLAGRPLAGRPPRPRLVSLAQADLVEVPASAPPPLPRAASSKPPPLSATLRRAEAVPLIRGEDAVERLFDALRDLDHEPDALAAAKVCVDALATVIPSRLVIAHAFDVTRREFLVVHARGTHADSMILERSQPNDPLLRIAMTQGVPFPWNDLRKAPVHRLARFSDLPSITRVLATPMRSGPRWLGALEIVDPDHDAPFTSEAILGARYVAERYAAFLGERGIVTDIGAIARFALHGDAQLLRCAR